MKTKVLIIMVAISMGFACSSTKNIAETKSKVETKINARSYTIAYNYVNPLRMRSHYLTSDYTLTIKGDSAMAYLPYFGVAHTAQYGTSEGGIKFNQPITGYSEKRTKKNDGWEISFSVKDEMRTYKMSLNIYDNANSSLDVLPSDKDPISFNGEVKL